jgi:glycosyltransferase involved in cell wall biosynthesis
MEKKRIVFFENTGCGTGSNISLKAILELLDRERFDVVLWFGDRGNQDRWPHETLYESKIGWLGNFDFFPAGFQVKWIKHFIGFLLKSLRDLLVVPKVLRELNPDLLHINSGQSLIVGVVAKKLGIPVVWHVRELVCENWLGRLQDRIYSYAAEQVIAISDAVAARLPYTMQQGKIVRMYNAVGLLSPPGILEKKHFIERLGLSDEKLIVLLLGHVSLVKGYGFLANVANLMENDDVEFVLAGRKSPEMKREVDFITKEWERHVHARRAVFSGHVDAATAISVADIVACPNLVKEPLGRTVMEASFLGTPVIAMRLPAFTETVIDGKTGWLLSQDPNVWADKLRELAGRRSVLAECSTTIDNLRSRFDDKKYIEDLQRIYSDLVATE